MLTVPDQTAADVSACVEAALTLGGSLTPNQQQLLADNTAELQARLASKWHDDQLGDFRTRDLLTVVRLTQMATDAPEATTISKVV